MTQIDLMFVGHAKAGKTSFAKGFLGSKKDQYIASEVPTTYVVSAADENGNTFQVCDTFKKTGSDVIIDNHKLYEKQHGIVFVYDLSANADQAKKEFVSFCQKMRDDAPNVPIFVVGTKADLVTEPTKKNIVQNKNCLDTLSSNNTELEGLKLGGVYFASESEPNNVDYNKCVSSPAQEKSAINSFTDVVSDIKKSVTPRLEKRNTAASQQSISLASYNKKLITVLELKNLLDLYQTTSLFACMGYMHSIIKKLYALTDKKDDNVNISGENITDCLSKSWCGCFSSKSSKYDMVEKHLQQSNMADEDYFKNNTAKTLVSIYNKLK